MNTGQNKSSEGINRLLVFSKILSFLIIGAIVYFLFSLPNNSEKRNPKYEKALKIDGNIDADRPEAYYEGFIDGVHYVLENFNDYIIPYGEEYLQSSYDEGYNNGYEEGSNQ